MIVVGCTNLPPIPPIATHQQIRLVPISKSPLTIDLGSATRVAPRMRSGAVGGDLRDLAAEWAQKTEAEKDQFSIHAAARAAPLSSRFECPPEHSPLGVGGGLLPIRLELAEEIATGPWRHVQCIALESVFISFNSFHSCLCQCSIHFIIACWHALGSLEVEGLHGSSCMHGPNASFCVSTLAVVSPLAPFVIVVLHRIQAQCL